MNSLPDKWKSPGSAEAGEDHAPELRLMQEASGVTIAELCRILGDRRGGSRMACWRSANRKATPVQQESDKLKAPHGGRQGN